MTVNFTVEETNLLCIFETSERAVMIHKLRESLNDWPEPEMKQLAQTVITRLEALTDEEYAAVDLTAEYDFEDEDKEE